MRTLALLFAAIAFVVLPAAAYFFWKPTYVRCVFDRNELGPMGDHGQWYWEYYKCDDGSERRELVAGPRG